MIVPQINYLMELDPTHMCVKHPELPIVNERWQCDDEDIEWPVYDEAKGG